MNILIVEDALTNCLLLQKILKHHGPSHTRR
jgi:hypothetical protein